MGLSSSSSKSSTNAVTTPQVPGFISQPYQQLAGGATALANTSPTSLGATGLQQQAFTGAQGLGAPNAGIAQGQQATAGLLGYQPQSVTAGQLSNTDLSPYMNPYTSNVVDATTAQLEQQRQRELNSNNAGATAAGAFGGNRQGVVDSLTNQDFNNTLASTVGGLLSSGYTQAQGAAQTDIANKLNADQYNGTLGLNATSLKVSLAAQLAAMGISSDANNRENLGLLSTLGDSQRTINEQNDPYYIQQQKLQNMAGLLGQIPSSLFTGQTVNSTTNQTSSPSLLSTLGSGVGLAGLLGWSPFSAAGGAASSGAMGPEA